MKIKLPQAYLSKMKIQTKLSALNALFRLDVCVCTNVNFTEPILCVNVCITINTMLNFDGYANADVKREHAFRYYCQINVNIHCFLEKVSRSRQSNQPLVSLTLRSLIRFGMLARSDMKYSTVPAKCQSKAISTAGSGISAELLG